MTEEARQLEPVRLFDDLGDVGATMKDFGPRLTMIESIEPDEETLHVDSAPGYDPEHRSWVSEAAKQEYLASLTHPLDADEGHPASQDPPTEQELFSVNESLTEAPKAQGTPAPD